MNKRVKMIRNKSIRDASTEKQRTSKTKSSAEIVVPPFKCKMRVNHSKRTRIAHIGHTRHHQLTHSLAHSLDHSHTHTHAAKAHSHKLKTN